MSKVYKATLIDGLIFVLLISPIWFPIVSSNINYARGWNLHGSNSRNLISLNLFIFYIFFIQGYFLFKDLLNISLGKRLNSLIIVDRKTGKEAHWLKKILRNLTLFFTPTLLIELVLKLITPKARFGDMIFDTEIRERVNNH